MIPIPQGRKDAWARGMEEVERESSRWASSSLRSATSLLPRWHGATASGCSTPSVRIASSAGRGGLLRKESPGCTDRQPSRRRALQEW
jgi:hypothetical protein